MQLTKDQLHKIQEFAKKHLSKNDSEHDLNHIKKTIEIAKLLLKKEKADPAKCMVIAWLHDIAKNKEGKKKDHGVLGAKTAEKFLKNIKIKKQDAKEICHAIEKHNKEGPQKTKAAEVIWDADKLQAMGIKGLLRGYVHFIKKGLKPEEAYKKAIQEQNFYIKRFHTKYGRKIAKKHFKAMIKFDKNYKKYFI